ncbi:MAG: hypothetical protein B7Y99_13470 [Caulobacterales bacterium 32-69-10]|nr:MAG: hypothetical protein B7Y99_13470 [Caulobacterales bacterium 32-69-10]
MSVKLDDLAAMVPTTQDPEAKARIAEERLRAAIDALPEGIVFLDAEGRYVLWNSRYAEIYQGTADLFQVGDKFEDTLRVGIARGHYPDAIGREGAWLAERLDKLKNPGPPHEQRLADGRWILIEERRTTDGGAVGIRVDITHLKHAEREAQEARERAEAASRAKTAFLANMSHEVRTPLNGVLGLAQVLMRTGLDSRQRELVETIVASAGHLNRILSDVLDISRAESGRMEVRCEPFHLGQLLNGLHALFGPKAADKGLAFEVHIAPEADVVVEGDPDRVQQVLANLVSNAVKFTASGGVSLRATFGQGAYRFEVRDTGIGFEPAIAERLFERFEQADSSITRAHGGSGLGLAICRELVELMGGGVWAHGEPGVGSVFTVDLPLANAALAPAMTDEPECAVHRDLAIRVLVAEDNPTNQKVVQLVLDAVGGFEVEIVGDGCAALEACRSRRYDVVLMDMHMPVMDGLTATRGIRAHEREANLPPTPLIMLSANVMAEHVAAALEAGADRHLPKPFQVGALIRTIDLLVNPDIPPIHALAS